MLRNFFYKSVNKFKGGDFRVDPCVPTSFITDLIIQRLIMAFRGLLKLGKFRKPVFIGSDVKIIMKSCICWGKGVTVQSGTIINGLSEEGLIFGDNVSIGFRSIIEGSGSVKFLGKGLKIGNNVGIGPYTHVGCAGGVTIGENTIMGNFVTIHPENHNFHNIDIPIKEQGVNHQGIKIGKDCWIGAKAMILDGAEIGEGCIIAGGAVVTKGYYPPHRIYGGNPAKFLKKRPGYEKKYKGN